jgi:hypothetical protein
MNGKGKNWLYIMYISMGQTIVGEMYMIQPHNYLARPVVSTYSLRSASILESEMDNDGKGTLLKKKILERTRYK